MNLSGVASIENGGGISVRIVDFLGKFARDLPIDFLAQQVGLRPENLMPILDELADRNIVKIDDGRTAVGLALQQKKSALDTFFQALSGRI